MDELYATTADRALDEILRAGTEEGASDIHIEPKEDGIRVRFRMDGTLVERFALPLSMTTSLAVRLKVIGHMDVGESRLPQDGRALFVAEGQTYDLRLSLLPSVYGETGVIRILSSRMDGMKDGNLGMTEEEKDLFEKALFLRRGMILVTGPTGSGKTSTLYSALQNLNQPEISIVSVEDPVEYRIPGVTQVEVHEKAGLTFARGLRSIVRQDPDVIMIGEIRDRETAEIAVHAALTGHLVLSTLHTNRAVDVPLRLADMGIPTYLLSATLSLVIGQRLVRKVCPHCKRETILTAKEMRRFCLPNMYEGQMVYEAVGCEDCHGRGYAGRTAVFEIWNVGREDKERIRNQVSPLQLQEILRKRGMSTMSDNALRLMKQGSITAEEAATIVGGDE